MAGKFYKQFGVISSFGPDCKVFFLRGERQNNNLEFADREHFPRNRAQNLKKPFEETLYSLFFSCYQKFKWWNIGGEHEQINKYCARNPRHIINNAQAE